MIIQVYTGTGTSYDVYVHRTMYLYVGQHDSTPHHTTALRNAQRTSHNAQRTSTHLRTFVHQRLVGNKEPIRSLNVVYLYDTLYLYLYT